MTRAGLTNNLNTTYIGRDVYFYESIDSTNAQAKRILKTKSLSEGTVFIASRQTAGRGSGNNTWESSEAAGLWFSIILHEPFKMNPLTFVPGIALAELLNKRYAIKAHLKWPNDVLVGHKKISGILCETVKPQEGKIVCVMGIGINVNQTVFSESIKDVAVSMAMITQQKYLLEDVFREYLLEFERLYFSSRNPGEEWKRYSKMINKNIQLLEKGKARTVKVLDITADGFLLVEEASGQERVISSRTDMDINPNY